MTGWTSKGIAEWLRDIRVIVAVVAGALGVMATLAWQAQGEGAMDAMGIASAEDIAALRAEMTAEMNHVRMDISQVNDGLDRLTNIVLRVTGEDQVARIDPDRTYIIPPVHTGDVVRLNLNLSRTERGQGCTFLGGSTLFEDSTLTPRAGSPLLPVVQISRQTVPLALRITPPLGLRLGRVVLWLELRYQCDGKVEYQKTRPIPFQLLPVRAPR